MIAAAAAAAAGSARLAVADDAPASSSPNEKLGVAIVGLKGRGGSHISALSARKDTEVLYVCDADTEFSKRSDEIAKRQGRAPKFETDLRKVLEDKRVDIVSIATPNHLHALQAIWSVQADKDVYVEKPVSHNVSEGRRIVEAAEKYKRIVQTGTQCRSNPGMIAAMEYVHSGKIGDVKVARGLCYKGRGSIGPKGDYPVPSTVDYDLWCGPAPKGPVTRKQFHYDWHWQWAYGCGDLGNQGIHQMDLARWGLKMDGLCKSVLSYGGRFGYIDAGETANTQVVVCDYGPKTLVFEVRGLKTDSLRGAGVGVIFEGTEGDVVMTSYHSGAAFDKSGKKITEFSGDLGDAGHFSNFITAVRSRKRADLHADILEGHLSSALCHLGNISYRLGATGTPEQIAERVTGLKCQDNVKETLERTLAHLKSNSVDVTQTPFTLGAALTLDPATETFQGNEKANAMLTREYRAPFIVPAKV
jgi:predicted dehydrogenase